MAVNGFPIIGGGGSADRRAGESTSATPAPVPAPTVDRFDDRAALALAHRQVERYGQRPAGSPQLRRLADDLRRRLPSGRFEPLPGHAGLRNVVGTLPGRGPAIVIAAHYDTLTTPRGFVGANNGAAGTAVVVQLARDFARLSRTGTRPRELRFVLFDGEEPPSGLPAQQRHFYATGLRGSRAYVAAHPGATHALVLLDYVGNRGLRLPREASSTPALWSQLRMAAQAVGVGAVFPDRRQARIVDDHTPFLRAGVQAIDLIDWSYPGHSRSDTLDKLSARSMDAVGEAVIELVRRLDSGRR